MRLRGHIAEEINLQFLGQGDADNGTVNEELKCLFGCYEPP